MQYLYMNLKNVYNGSEEIGFSFNHIRLPMAEILLNIGIHKNKQGALPHPISIKNKVEKLIL